MNKVKDVSFETISTIFKERIMDTISLYIERVPSLELKQVIHYTLENSGKRIRPLLVYAVGEAFKADIKDLDAGASAIELMHTYALIHDDLPSMDNAPLRRGKATAHTMFGEALAILAGDALQTLAFQILAAHPSKLSPVRRLQMIEALGEAAGSYGMVSGQAMDIISFHDVSLTKEMCERIYHYKTAMLIQAAVQLGYFAGKLDDEKQYDNLCVFGNELGIAFQIQDDIFDIEKGTSSLGKEQGTDARNKKLTYPHLIGIENAKQEVDRLFGNAFSRLDYLGQEAQLLRELIQSIWHREH